MEIREFLKQETQEFRPISLKELDAIQLLNRIDSKYLFHINSFSGILSHLKEHYPILEIGGTRVFRYETHYYDSIDWFLYKMHHNGRIDRFKVRTRKYVDSGLQYFEVKYKVKSTRTLKERIPIKEDQPLKAGNDLFSRIKWGRHRRLPLEMKLKVFFNRLTLAGFNPNERITLDFDVTFRNQFRSVSFPDLVVAEVKQNKSNIFSPFLQEIKKYHLEEIGFSKYSMGVALLEDVKHNNFKPNIIRMQKILSRNYFLVK